MVYESRIKTANIVPKPTVYIDGRFPELHQLEVGASGQMDCELLVEGMSLDMDFNGNEHMTYRVNIQSSKLIRPIKTRL
jgi:hypothetical protein